MKKLAPFFLILFCSFCSTGFAVAHDNSKPSDTSDKARVFIASSESWEVAGGVGGTSGGFGGASHGGARPQTAEILKTFGERCPEVVTNNLQEKADYIVLLDHEGGKSVLQHRNKVAVFARMSGDSVVSKSTFSLGASVQEACEAIHKDWAAHGSALRAAAAAAESKAATSPTAVSASSSVAMAPTTAKLSIASSPDGADIEVDGSFVGNTPSEVQVAEGDHTVLVKKNGFAEWNRKLKVSAGSTIHLNAELEKAASQ
jgi:protein-tyrosine-phosphatase